MCSRNFISVGALAVLAVVASLVPIGAANQAPAGAATPKRATAKTWIAPRTADGQPDLQGVWANNMATPLERPKELADKAVLTDKELEDFKDRAAQLFGSGGSDAVFGDGLYQAIAASLNTYVSRDGKTGNYNQFWLVDREFENRTSTIFNPPDGKLPPLTPEAKQRQDAAAAARLRPPAGPEDRGLSERCLTFGVPRIGGINSGYNSYYQIFQTRDYVAINNEMYHESRLIPLDGRPHLPSSVRPWLGDSRGRWEGDTLVVDTTNFSPKSNYLGARENLHVIERFTRTGPDTVKYEVTVEDPTTWTKPWSAWVSWKHSKEPIYEVACHEGNYGMAGILSGARAEEKAAEAAAKKGSR